MARTQQRARQRQKQAATDATPNRSPRVGPRPLPLHLSMAALTWMSSLAALPHLKSGSLPWKSPLRESAQSLVADLQAVEAEALTAAVEREVRRRLAAFADGLEAYRRHPYRRALPEPRVAWQEGTTRLLDYGDGAAGPPLLVVPSLINRAYILDLSAETSLLRWLAGHGLRPFLVDWERPGPEERRFTLTDYIVGRLERALDAVRAETGRLPVLAGYCMGGLLALPLAERRGADLAGLALLATPWDFQADGGTSPHLIAAGLAGAAPALELLGEMPVDLVQALFAALDPEVAVKKFLAFSRMDPESPRARRFVALEDWLNDGVPLAAPVARECLGGWYGENTPARKAWRIAGRPVDPGRVALPTLCLLPGQDRIVPPASARALAEAIPGAESLAPPVGHIGMIVSGDAREKVWTPFLRWLAANAASHDRPAR